MSTGVQSFPAFALTGVTGTQMWRNKKQKKKTTKKIHTEVKKKTPKQNKKPST